MEACDESIHLMMEDLRRPALDVFELHKRLVGVSLLPVPTPAGCKDPAGGEDVFVESGHYNWPESEDHRDTYDAGYLLGFST